MLMLKGWQEPPIYSLPDNVYGSLGQQCTDLAALGGLHLDPWQTWLVHHTCSYTPEQVISRMGDPVFKWAAKTVGVMVSRQNGKGSFLEARELAGLFLFGEKLIIHSAHEFKTSMNHMERMIELIKGHPDFHNEIAAIRRSNGSEGIVLKSGQELKFQTRTKGGGRGLTPDLIVIDEAMYVTPEQMAALKFAISAVPNAQTIYTGSAGTKESVQFGNVRNRGMAFEDEYDPTMFYAEWSIDPHTGLCLPTCRDHDDPSTEEAIAKSNPGYNIRLFSDTIEEERKEFKEAPHILLRERFGVGDWPSEAGTWVVIGKDEWMDRRNRFSEIEADSPKVLAIHTSPDGKYTGIVACGRSTEGDEHIEVTGRGTQYDYRPGVRWVVPVAVRMAAEWGFDTFVIHKGSQAASFIEDLEFYGFTVISPTAAEFASSCKDFVEAIAPSPGEYATLVHMGQPPLTASVASALKKEVANSWFWDQRADGGDITLTVSATLARWGYRRVRNAAPVSEPWSARR